MPREPNLGAGGMPLHRTLRRRCRRLDHPPALRPAEALNLVPRSLLAGCGGGLGFRRQQRERCHLAFVLIPEELAPLRLGHVLPPRIRPRRPLVGLELVDVVLGLVAGEYLRTAPPQPR